MDSMHFLRTHGTLERNDLQFGMGICPDYCQNCLDFSHGH